jgi:hypothetical protein
MFSPDGKLGMQLNGTSRVYNVILRTRDSAFDLEGVTTEYAVDAAVFLPVGVRIWNPNAGSFTSPGWTVTEASTQATTVATLTPMPQLTGSVTLVSNVVDVGNVGTGEDDLITYTLPANTLAAEGQSLEIEAGFSLAANANSKTLKMYLGANDCWVLAGAAQNDGSYYVRIVVIRDAVNTAKVVVTAARMADQERLWQCAWKRFCSVIRGLLDELGNQRDRRSHEQQRRCNGIPASANNPRSCTVAGSGTGCIDAPKLLRTRFRSSRSTRHRKAACHLPCSLGKIAPKLLRTTFKSVRSTTPSRLESPEGKSRVDSRTHWRAVLGRPINS